MSGKHVKVIIDTRKGYKSATLMENFGVDIINTIDIISSQWIEFQPGENIVGWNIIFLIMI